ncbi:AAA family ATPase [Neorhodopirellula lusitana]|uniref:AAA family ATPase n=1 Tax=Neorhodopirellula lusitana TaxID=445327 RepID=UPI00384ACDD5
MTLQQRVSELVRACFAGIWIESHEHTDAVTELVAMCREEQWQLVTWDIERGLRGPNGSPTEHDASDPLAAVRAVSSLADGETPAIVVLQNFHRFMQSAEIVQAMAHAIHDGKQRRGFVVILSPVVQLPVELEKLFVTVEHALPDRQQLLEVAVGIATEDDEMPQDAQLDAVLDAAAGLTRYEAEGAYSLSLVREGRLTPSTIWELKTQAVQKSGLLSLYRGGETFDSLGGLDVLKAFTRRAMSNRRRDGQTVQPRGVMLLSPPGCGKTAFCKALGQEVGRPVLTLDVGSLMGSLVGQSEERTRQALAIVDAMAPCVLMIDEVEKAFAGAAGGGSHDSGVSSRMMGTFLTWLNDHQSEVFVICTANDVKQLPPEFSRAERFDGVFFVDLPNRQQKDSIWTLYVNQYGIGTDDPRPDDKQWTGAEIKSCCRLSALLGAPLAQAALNIVPIAVTSIETVDRLRQWASGRCLSADQPGVYRHDEVSPQRRRRVSTQPSQN